MNNKYLKARQLLAAVFLMVIAPSAAAISQLVFLDFVSESGDADDWVYTAGEIAAIEAKMVELYSPYGVTFTSTMPVSGDYATIKYNTGAIGTTTPGIDFRNTIKSDLASIDAKKGLEFVAAPVTSDNIVKASINLGAHEFNHLLGARHHDAFGLPGGGVSTVGNTLGFDPVYPGPTGAATTGIDVASLTTVLGFSEAKLTSEDPFIGVRTALKILFPDHGISHAEDVGTTLTTDMGMPGPQMLTTASWGLPNNLPVPPGDPLSTAAIFVKAVSVRGEIAAGGESDYFSFGGIAGEVWTIEVMSDSLEERLVEGDLSVALLEGTGLIPYYTDFSLNLDCFEGPDPCLLDIILPSSGEFIIEVFGDTPMTTGEYELLAYSVSLTTMVPVPPALGFMAVSLASLFGFRHYRRAKS